MALSNEELVDKVRKGAAIEAADLTTGGKLNDEQSNRFIDFVFDESVLPSFSRIVRFRPENATIDKIGLGKRVAMPAAEATDPGRRRGVTTSKVTLTPKEIMVPTELSDDFKQFNIEGDDVVTHILQIFGKQLANNTEELHIHGDTGGILQFEDELENNGNTTEVVEDTYLKLYDGILKQADSGHVVDAAGAVLSANLFRKAINAMPSKFKRNKRDLAFLVPVELEELWRERVASRATGAGDKALTSDGNMMVFGYEIIPVPNMEFYPLQVQTIAFTGANSTIQLNHAPVMPGSIIVQNNANVFGPGNPRPPYALTTDYTVDETNGTVTHVGAGNIGANETVRITYRSYPQILFVARNNIIIAIGRDITMESDRDIYRRVDMFATTVKYDVKYEELDAVVKVKNVSDDL